MKSNLLRPKPRFLFLLLSIFILMLSSVSAINVQFDTLEFDEDFEYGTFYVANGYTHTTNFAPAPAKPLDVSGFNTGNNLAYSVQDITLTPPDSMQTAQLNAWTGNDLIDINKTPIISFQYFQNDSSDGEAQPTVITITNDNNNNEFFVFTFLSSSNVWYLDNNINSTVGQDCQTDALDLQELQNLTLFMNYPEKTYSFYVNGVCDGSCCEQILGTPDSTAGANGIRFRMDSGNDGIERFIDNVKIGEGTINGSVMEGEVGIFCEEYAAFCDTFNYDTSLYSTNGWLVGLSDFSFDTSYPPVDNKLKLNATTQELRIAHTVINYKAKFVENADLNVTRTPYVPVSTSEFIFNSTSIGNELPATDCVHYEGNTKDLRDIYEIAFCRDNNMLSIYARDNLGDDTSYFNYCDECFELETEYLIRIITFFDSRTHTELNLFNTTHTDKVVVTIREVGQTAIMTLDDIPFLDPTAADIREFAFSMYDDANAEIDDYVVMSGTSDTESTLSLFSTGLFEDDNLYQTTGVPTYENDFADGLDSAWNSLGLKSPLSRFIVGILIVALVTIIMFSYSVEHGVQVNVAAIIIADIFVIILLILAKLISIWVLIIILVLAAGVSAWSIMHGGMGSKGGT